MHYSTYDKINVARMVHGEILSVDFRDFDPNLLVLVISMKFHRLCAWPSKVVQTQVSVPIRNVSFGFQTPRIEI